MNRGEWLKVARINSNLSSNDVASALGISARHIQYIEKDERTPSLELLEGLCKLYGIKNVPVQD